MKMTQQIIIRSNGILNILNYWEIIVKWLYTMERYLSYFWSEISQNFINKVVNLTENFIDKVVSLTELGNLVN